MPQSYTDLLCNDGSTHYASVSKALPPPAQPSPSSSDPKTDLKQSDIQSLASVPLLCTTVFFLHSALWCNIACWVEPSGQT